MKIEYYARHEGILKEYLKELGLSRSFMKKVKLYGKMYINDQEVKNYFPIQEGDKIVLEYSEEENDNIITKEVSLDICYEDDHLLIINKPESLAVQPSHKHYEENVVSYVKAYFKKNNIISNVHIVNRLDYATSGLMIVAKDGFTHYALTKEKIITRKYYAVIKGLITPKEGVIDLPIKRESEERDGNIRRIVSFDGKKAITHYRVINESKEKNLSLIDVKLDTGRTHQIRVHFKTLGYPLLGDKIYGEEDDRLYLHCYHISFINPYTNQEIIIEKFPDFEKKIFQY